MKKLLTKLLAGFISLVCVCAMAACAPKLDIDKAEDSLREKGYVIKVERRTDYYDVEGLRVERVLTAMQDDLMIMIVEFSDKKTAELVYEMETAVYEAEIVEIDSEIALLEHLLDKYQDKLLRKQLDEWEDSLKILKKENNNNK